MFPLEKYTYIVKGKTVKALQTYANQVYVGVAHCAPEDEFDFEKGKELAAARCNEKIAKARFNYARKKYYEAYRLKNKAMRQFEKCSQFLDDADEAYSEATYEKEMLEEDLGVEFNGVEG